MTSLVTLNQNQIVEDRHQIIDIVLARFYIAKYSQSNALLGKVQSFNYIVMLAGEEGGINKSLLSKYVKDSIEILLRQYFDSINTIVTIVDSQTTVGAVDIQLMFTGNYKGVTYSADRVWEVKDSKLKVISDLL